ncbi:hypothetical protein VNO78_05480 [Psophocarpus tetragonolobus]|uniref:Uncharacterized protein n=1 Tax=Psophocarpus tetragonolobus TaxID=3891 RepID=A0AAN9XQR9_PSOTE
MLSLSHSLTFLFCSHWPIRPLSSSFFGPLPLYRFSNPSLSLSLSLNFSTSLTLQLNFIKRLSFTFSCYRINPSHVEFLFFPIHFLHRSVALFCASHFHALLTLRFLI